MEPGLVLISGIILFVNCASVKWASRMQNVFTIFKMVVIVMLIITGVVRLGQGKLLWCQESKDQKVVFFTNNNYYIWSKGITIHSQSKLVFFLISLPLRKIVKRAIFNRVIESVCILTFALVLKSKRNIRVARDSADPRRHGSTKH